MSPQKDVCYKHHDTSGVWAKHHSTEYNSVHSLARHHCLRSVLELKEKIVAEVYLAAAMNCGSSCSSQLISPLYMNEISIWRCFSEMS